MLTERGIPVFGGLLCHCPLGFLLYSSSMIELHSHDFYYKQRHSLGRIKKGRKIKAPTQEVVEGIY